MDGPISAYEKVDDRIADIANENITIESNKRGNSETSAENVHKHPTRWTNYITVEPTVIGMMFVMAYSNIFAKEYINQAIASKYNLDLNRSTEQSCSSIKENTSDPYYELEQKVSSETASWSLYLTVSSCIPALVSTILLGSWGDKVGRKIPILISSFGIIIFIGCYLLVVIFSLPLHFLFVGHVLSGILGNYGNLIGCAFSHLSDITTPKQRTLRIAMLEAGIGIGSFLASISSGFWDLSKGYQNPYWCMLGLTIFNFLYAVVFLPSNNELKPKRIFRHLFSKEPFVHMYQVMRPRQNRRHIALLLYATCFGLMISAMMGANSLLIIYAIDVPFCFNSLLLGILSGLGQINFFVSLLLLAIFSSFSSQPKLLTLSFISSSISAIVIAFSKTTWMLFFAQLFHFLSNIPAPIIRSQSSRLVSRDEVGSVFAVLACSMAIGETVGSFVFQGIYAATTDTVFPGASFIVAAVFMLIAIPLYWTGYRLSGLKKPSSARQYDILTDEDCAVHVQ